MAPVINSAPLHYTDSAWFEMIHGTVGHKQHHHSEGGFL